MDVCASGKVWSVDWILSGQPARLLPVSTRSDAVARRPAVCLVVCLVRYAAVSQRRSLQGKNRQIAVCDKARSTESQEVWGADANANANAKATRDEQDVPEKVVWMVQAGSRWHGRYENNKR